MGGFDNKGWCAQESAAFLSLKTALLAYFETYRATFQEFSNPLEFEGLKNKKEFDSDLYKSLYFTTITHFQNFFELFFKDALGRIDEIFVFRWNEKFTSALYERICRKEVRPVASDLSIEYSDALKRLLEIRKADERNPIIQQIDFLLNERETLEELNDLRNRIWHRGLFYLYYAELDLFICKEVLPLIEQIAKLDWYPEKQEWKYKPLSCGIDPIKDLISEIRKDSIDLERIALIKEMGRSAFHNPIIQKGSHTSPFVLAIAANTNRETVKNASARANVICQKFLTDIFVCPVCGQKTLVKYEIDDYDTDCDANGNEIQVPRYIPDRIKCEVCSFEVLPNITDLTKCGIVEPNLWDVHN